MSTRVLIDSNIVIDLLNGIAEAKTELLYWSDGPDGAGKTLTVHHVILSFQSIGALLPKIRSWPHAALPM